MGTASEKVFQQRQNRSTNAIMEQPKHELSMGHKVKRLMEIEVDNSHLIMVALWNSSDHYIFILWFLLLSSFFLSFFSSPNLGRRRVDVYHTCTHDVAFVRI